MARKKKSTDRKGSRIFGITSRVLMAVAAALLVLSYGSMLINPAKAWGMSLLGLLFVPLSVVNLILLLWALKRLSRSFVIPLLALLPSLFFIGRYARFSSEEIPQSQEPTLKIMSYNVGRFSLHDEKSGISTRSQCADSVFAMIRRQNPDIVCLQEFRISDLSKVRSYLGRQMKGYKADFYLFPSSNGSAFGNVTLSRIPVIGKGKIKFDESANLAIYTDYETHGRRFRVYNCHFESYNISLPGILRGLLRADKAIVSQTGSKMKLSITKRPKQVDMVFSDIEKCPIESFVCGDFNDNPMSYSYYRMTRGRKDSFCEAGKGFGATFAGLWPLLRIDYVMLPDRFKALSHESPRLKYSDHYPVITTIEL
jgi:endonuclease/exonuclease/phosphatase family metal-dependent hydrolase